MLLELFKHNFYTKTIFIKFICLKVKQQQILEKHIKFSNTLQIFHYFLGYFILLGVDDSLTGIGQHVEVVHQGCNPGKDGVQAYQSHRYQSVIHFYLNNN